MLALLKDSSPGVSGLPTPDEVALEIVETKEGLFQKFRAFARKKQLWLEGEKARKILEETRKEIEKYDVVSVHHFDGVTNYYILTGRCRFWRN